MSKEYPIFKWLHLSDIHFSKKAGYNTNYLRSSLLEYLKDLGEKYDCMVLPGDFRYAPDKITNTDEIVEYINKLLVNTRVSNDSIVLAPGNHDLKRDNARKALANNALNEYLPENGTFDPSILSLLLSNDYFKFYDSLKAQIANKEKVISLADNPHSVIDMGNCYFLVLNTALLSYGGDADKNKITIGCNYVLELIEKIRNDKKPIIAVGHHGVDWFSEEERKKILPLFRKNGINLYLCGHSNEFGCKKINDDVLQVTVGCMKQKDNNVDAAFSVGELYENGNVYIGFHKWDNVNQEWKEFPTSAEKRKKTYNRLYIIPSQFEQKETLIYNPFLISKVHPIPPRGRDGVKYIWKKFDEFVESAAFNNRLKESQNIDDDNKTSAYTISTSIGCLLSAMRSQCKFCETGKRGFAMPLTADDIALQCIFMAKYDMSCKNHPMVHDHKREFAFMGQGEPGFNYDAVKKAIMLNDIAMRHLNQEVSRYIISTCGISDFLSSLIIDTKNKVFGNKVTVHFSLHVNGQDRDNLMPINKHYDYHEFINLCKKYHMLTNDKIGVGILLFNKYVTSDASVSYNLTRNKLMKILKELDKNVFRIDLCTLNQTKTGSQNQMSEEVAEQLHNLVLEKGFECKLFSSFGDNNNSGCGMLSSNTDRAENPGASTIKAFNEALQLLRKVKEEYEEFLLTDEEPSLLNEKTSPSNKEDISSSNKEEISPSNEEGERNNFSDFF